MPKLFYKREARRSLIVYLTKKVYFLFERRYILFNYPDLLTTYSRISKPRLIPNPWAWRCPCQLSENRQIDPFSIWLARSIQGRLGVLSARVLHYHLYMSPKFLPSSYDRLWKWEFTATTRSYTYYSLKVSFSWLSISAFCFGTGFEKPWIEVPPYPRQEEHSQGWFQGKYEVDIRRQVR